MDKKDLREGIAKYIEKYYEPEEDFSLKDEKVKATFSEIDNLRAAKAEEAMMSCVYEDVAPPVLDDISDEDVNDILDDLGLSESNPDKFDINTAEFTRIENPMSRMIVTGRSIDVPDDVLSLRSKGVILKQMEEVLNRLACKHTRVVGRVGDIMGGKVVKMEWLEKYDKAFAEGEARGRAEGENERKALADEVRRLKEELEKMKVSAMA